MYVLQNKVKSPVFVGLNKSSVKKYVHLLRPKFNHTEYKCKQIQASNLERTQKWSWLMGAGRRTDSKNNDKIMCKLNV